MIAPDVPGLVIEQRAEVAWLRVDRLDAHNTLTPEMYEGFGAAYDAVAESDSVRALVLTGTGKVFVAGGDVSADAGPRTDVDLPFDRLLGGEVPVVAAVNGLCQASGVTMAMLADVTIASDRATFRIPELHAGFPDTWLAALLPAHVGMGRARELALTARRFDAAEAERIGLVGRVVPHDDLEQAAGETVDAILGAGPEARAKWRRAAHALYPEVDVATFEAGLTSGEAKEGFDAILGHRPPAWAPGADHD